MADKFTRIPFERMFNVEKIITLFYMEMSKNFHYDGESHDFWEMVYIDKGQMVCTADKNRFLLKSGEMTFHKPNEYHNLSGDSQTAPNLSSLTFECKSRAMKQFEGKIFRLSPEEKSILSKLFEEGMATYRLVDEKDPLLQSMVTLDSAPYGSSQMVKNLLEIFLIQPWYPSAPGVAMSLTVWMSPFMLKKSWTTSRRIFTAESPCRTLQRNSAKVKAPSSRYSPATERTASYITTTS